MPQVPRSALAPMLALLSALAWAPLLRAQPKVAKLEARVAETRARSEEAQAALRAVWMRLEDGLAAPDLAARKAMLTNLTLALEAQERANRGRLPARPALEAALRDLLEAPLRRLATPLARRALAAPPEVAQRGPAARAEHALQPLLEPSVPFWKRWNEFIAPTLPEAVRWARCREQLATQERALAVARDPVLRFQEGAPAGYARVEPGSYLMRSVRGMRTGPRAKDRQRFRLRRAVWIALHEVTVADYLRWLDTLPADERERHLPRRSSGQPLWSARDTEGRLTASPEVARHPVGGVRLLSAMRYAEAQGARLPTEQEWMAAAAGPKGLDWPWGNEWKEGRCHCEAEGAETPSNPVTVGNYLGGRGPFGHFDLAGNVAEWTSTNQAGRTLLADKLSEGLPNAIVRGGSFANGKRDVMTGRVDLFPAASHQDPRIGFRLARDPD